MNFPSLLLSSRVILIPSICFTTPKYLSRNPETNVFSTYWSHPYKNLQSICHQHKVTTIHVKWHVSNPSHNVVQLQLGVSWHLLHHVHAYICILQYHHIKMLSLNLVYENVSLLVPRYMIIKHLTTKLTPLRHD